MGESLTSNDSSFCSSSSRMDFPPKPSTLIDSDTLTWPENLAFPTITFFSSMSWMMYSVPLGILKISTLGTDLFLISSSVADVGQTVATSPAHENEYNNQLEKTSFSTRKFIVKRETYRPIELGHTSSPCQYQCHQLPLRISPAAQ